MILSDDIVVTLTLSLNCHKRSYKNREAKTEHFTRKVTADTAAMYGMKKIMWYLNIKVINLFHFSIQMSLFNISNILCNLFKFIRIHTGLWPFFLYCRDALPHRVCGNPPYGDCKEILYFMALTQSITHFHRASLNINLFSVNSSINKGCSNWPDTSLQIASHTWQP